MGCKHRVGDNCKKDDRPCIHNADCFEPVPKTNADRIRAMSDEELAEFMDAKPLCPDNELFDNCPCDCRVCWGKWLRQPVKDGEGDG